MEMSLAGEGDGENSDTCRSGARLHQVSSMMNNVPIVRTSEDVETVVPRRRVWRLGWLCGSVVRAPVSGGLSLIRA